MSGEVPPILWFVFWVGLSVGLLSFGFFMAIIIHRGNMKALEILRFYAEKGMEPPPAVFEMLNRQMGGTDGERAGKEVGRKAGNFAGLVIAACIPGAIAWWRMDNGGPQWVIYLCAVIAMFWAVRAISYLIAARNTSEK
jgi:hypothetical protein